MNKELHSPVCRRSVSHFIVPRGIDERGTTQQIPHAQYVNDHVQVYAYYQ
jgi:hypothetical protein